jgi:hypothetical protein
MIFSPLPFASGIIFTPNYTAFERFEQLCFYVNPFTGTAGGMGSVRQGIIFINIIQDAACTFTLAKTAHNFSASGGTGVFSLIQSDSVDRCQSVGATAQASSFFVRLENPQPDAATIGVSYTVSPNNTTQARTATVTLTPRVDFGTMSVHSDFMCRVCPLYSILSKRKRLPNK